VLWPATSAPTPAPAHSGSMRPPIRGSSPRVRRPSWARHAWREPHSTTQSRREARGGGPRQPTRSALHPRPRRGDARRGPGDHRRWDGDLHHEMTRRGVLGVVVDGGRIDRRPAARPPDVRARSRCAGERRARRRSVRHPVPRLASPRRDHGRRTKVPAASGWSHGVRAAAETASSIGPGSRSSTSTATSCRGSRRGGQHPRAYRVSVSPARTTRGQPMLPRHLQSQV
jgi:hypothetical protein